MYDITKLSLLPPSEAAVEPAIEAHCQNSLVLRFALPMIFRWGWAMSRSYSIERVFSAPPQVPCACVCCAPTSIVFCLAGPLTQAVLHDCVWSNGLVLGCYW